MQLALISLVDCELLPVFMRVRIQDSFLNSITDLLQKTIRCALKRCSEIKLIHEKFFELLLCISSIYDQCVCK